MNWGSLLNIVLLAASLRAAIVAFGPAAQRVGDDLNLSGASLGLLGALPVLAFALVAGFVDRPVRWLGFDRVALISLLALALGLVTRLLEDAWAMWVGTAVIGLAIGVLNVIAPAFVKRDFPTRMSFVTGIYTAVMAAAAAASIALVTPLTNAFDGNWRVALTASLPVVLLAIALQAVRYFRERRATAREQSNAPVPIDPGKGTAARVWRSPLAWAVTAYMGLQSLFFYAFMTWAPSIEMASGFTEAQAGVHLSIGQILGIIGSLMMMSIMQNIRDKRIVAVAIPLAGGVPVLGMIIAPSLFPLWTPLLGFVLTSLLGVALVLIGERAGSVRDAAALSGMAQSVGYLVASVGPVFIGGLYDATNSWTPALWSLFGVLLLIGVAGFIAGQNKIVGETAR